MQFATADTQHAVQGLAQFALVKTLAECGKSLIRTQVLHGLVTTGDKNAQVVERRIAADVAQQGCGCGSGGGNIDQQHFVAAALACLGTGAQLAQRIDSQIAVQAAQSQLGEHPARALQEGIVATEHQGADADQIGTRLDITNGFLQRYVEPERRAFAQFRAHADLALHELDQALADDQAKAGAAVHTRGGGIRLRERLEQLGSSLVTEADAGVAHGKGDLVVAA